METNPITVPKAPEGVTLSEALKKWVDREAAEEMIYLKSEGYGEDFYFTGEVPPTFHQIQATRYLTLRDQLESKLLSKLHSGELVAIGFGSHAPLESVVIPPERWRALTPDIYQSLAKAEGLVISGIRVFAGNAPNCPNVPKESRKVALGKLPDWFRDWIESNQAAGVIPSREDDLEAAKKALGNVVRRDVLRRLRRELAPKEWSQQGRRKWAK
jgi:hypothetical protein